MLSSQHVKSALCDIIQSYKSPRDGPKLEEAKSLAGSDTVRLMQLVFPVATHIQMEVIANYGFDPSPQGAIKFINLVKKYAKEDDEINSLFLEMKSIYMPPLGANEPLDMHSALV